MINLSANNLRELRGLAELPELQNLNVSQNHLSDFESVSHLGECSSTLTNLDLSHNQIVYDERFCDLIPQMKVLYLMGNPFVREVEHYRRSIVGRLKNLLYLDERNILQEERELAEMWVELGKEGFKKKR